MRIALAKDVEEFLREQVSAGLAADPGELANHILRCFCTQQRKPFRTAPQLDARLKLAADKPTTPFGKRDVDGVRRRERKV
jgi:hypothetical protein